ncbi:MAG: tetratricopeptide repeat protein [Calditrichaceae bacterium]|nr:tetratricopeptide repeat protein [Calditrichaceae bacterium]MBN2707560.1 tetratricopeptide repeat protein [Calditrichaceae bacterium]RQV95645.1 MAG: tetratricopeptide repeat protein [Calditrichota bacterium]
MKRSILVIISILMTLQLVLAQSESKSPEAGQAYNEGLTLIRQKKYNEALEKFKAAVKADNNFPKAHYMLGLTYKSLNNFSAAEKEYKKAIEIDRKFSPAFIGLGKLQAQQGKNMEALNTFKAILTYDEKDYKAQYEAGKVLYEMKQYSEAEKYLAKSVAIQPDYVYALNLLGLTYKELNNFDKAVEAMKNAVKNEKKAANKADYQFRLGQVYLEMRSYKAAEEVFLQALKNTRKNAIKSAANFYLGETYKKMGRSAEAVRYYSEASKTSQWKQAAEYEIDLIKNPDKYSN